MSTEAQTDVVSSAASSFFSQTWRSLPARQTHARAQIVIKKQVDPSRESHSHLVCWVEGSICIIVNV